MQIINIIAYESYIWYDGISIILSVENKFKIIFLKKGPISPRARLRDFKYRISMFLVP